MHATPSASPALRCISSMATRFLLAELAEGYARAPGGGAVDVVSVGGVDAARRVAAGEAFDVVVLAADGLAPLLAAGQASPGSRRVVALSHMAIAVAAGAAAPDVSTEAGLQAVLLAADAIGYSTGPSGRALHGLLARWGLLEALQPVLVQSPPGVPVARLLAEGRAAIGFQQRSELLREPGVTVLGDMPPGAGIVTPFEAAVCAASPAPDQAAHFIGWLCAAASAAAKQRAGLEHPAAR